VASLQGFLILAHLISRTWTTHITIDLAIAFKKMAQAILNSRTTFDGNIHF